MFFEYECITLENVGKLAVPSLIAALEDDDWHFRQEVAEILGVIGDSSAIEPLCILL